MATSKQQGMKNAHLHELLVDGMKDMLWAERHLLKGLKKMSKYAQGATLKEAFESHHQQTEEHIVRLKEGFGYLNLAARGKKCKAMEGLLGEADELAEEFEDSPEVLDAALIVAAQKIEHYEIASYGCLATFAELMEHKELLTLLKKTLEEERNTDVKLTEIALTEANLSTEVS